MSQAVLLLRREQSAQLLAVALTAGGLVEISHRGALVATRARRHRPGADPQRAVRPPAGRRPTSAAAPVVRKVDPTGYVSFAGTGYFVSARLSGEQVEVRLVGRTVQIARGGELLKTDRARHDPGKERSAFATPLRRPRRSSAAADSEAEGCNTAAGANV